MKKYPGLDGGVQGQGQPLAREWKLNLLPDQLIGDHTPKHAMKGASWHFKIFDILSGKQTVNGAFQIIDCSRQYPRGAGTISDGQQV